ncbi:hypothetical protein [Streptomyces anandii]|uniref:hypothetical protein n=1 Tax=Streptomyces anandii TaxID=285454 RepID=UPI0037B4BBEB
MPAAENPSRPYAPAAAAVSMRDLLASCAAAEAVSRPPRAPEPRPESLTPRSPRPADGPGKPRSPRPADDRREAA